MAVGVGQRCVVRIKITGVELRNAKDIVATVESPQYVAHCQEVSFDEVSGLVYVAVDVNSAGSYSMWLEVRFAEEVVYTPAFVFAEGEGEATPCDAPYIVDVEVAGESVSVTPPKIDVDGGDDVSRQEFEALVNKVADKQDTLTLTTKPNGNIVIGNLAGQSKEFMPATPSGDPMHYVYISVGATYDSNTGLWSYLPNFGGLTDITTSQMKTIFAESWLYTGDTGRGMWFAMEGRININKCRWVNTIAVNSYCRYANAVEVFVLREALNEVYASEYAYSFTNCPKLKRIIGNVNISSLTKLTGTFVALPKLEEVRLKGLKCDVSFADSPNLSTESILYMIENATATSAITITLHEDAYMRAHENNDIIHALDIKEKVSIASA